MPEEIGWAPAIDVYEKEDKFVVKAELPGLKEEDIDTDKIEASYEDGVLEVNLPKTPEVKPKKVGISVKKKADK